MVHLFNIFVEADNISCDYEPEKSGKIGHVTVNTETEEIVKVDYSQYEYGKKMYVAQVRAKLAELLRQKDHIPSETFALWY